MSAHLAPVIGLVILALTAGLALYYWRRSAGLYALLVEGANRFEELRGRAGTLEQALGAAEGKFKLHRETVQRLTAGLEEAREKSGELTRRLDQKEHEGRIISDKLELQKGHLERQVAKVQELLGIAEEQRRAAEAETEAVKRQAELDKAAAAAEAAKRPPLRADKQGTHEKGDKPAGADRPETLLELKRMKRKLAQYDRLYASMKGLREMTEERNRNWEVALRKLSAWILTETGRAKTTLPEAIGPLVGQAMQAIGAQLVDDHIQPRVGAGVVHSMDDEHPVDAEEIADEPDPSEEAKADTIAVLPEGS